MHEAKAPDPVETLDALAEQLQELRASTGLSYRAIAARIAQQREDDGLPPAAAQIAHTTVSDAFRRGRSRINAELVTEIVRAMGGSAADGELWRERCVRAMSRTQRADSAGAVNAPTGSPVLPTPDASLSVSPWQTILLVVVAAVLLNSTGKFLNPLAGDLLFLDMIGTAVAALLLGPWWAALTGLLFLSVQLLKGDVGGALFATTMVSAGLIWGYGVHRFGLGRTLPRFLLLSGLVAVTTTAVAVPIIVLYYNGAAGRGADEFVFWATGQTNVWAAVTVANIVVSLADKVLSGAIAYGLVRVIQRFGSRPLSDPLR